MRQVRSLAAKGVRETPGTADGAQGKVLSLRLGAGAYALRVTGTATAGELLERELSAMLEGDVRFVFVDLGSFEMEPVTAAALESAQVELRQRGGDLVVVADGPSSSFRTLEAAIRSLSPGFRARRGLAQEL